MTPCKLRQRPLISSLNRVSVAGELVMEFTFEVENVPIKFSRNHFTGRCTLNPGAEEKALQPPWNPFTHFTLKKTSRWQCSVKGHELSLNKPVLGLPRRFDRIRI